MRELGLSHTRRRANDPLEGKKFFGALVIAEQYDFSAYDFFTEKKQSGDLHTSAAFDHILFENMNVYSHSSPIGYYYDDKKNDGKDIKLLKELDIKSDKALHVLCHIAYILSDDDRIKKKLLKSGKKK